MATQNKTKENIVMKNNFFVFLIMLFVIILCLIKINNLNNESNFNSSINSITQNKKTWLTNRITADKSYPFVNFLNERNGIQKYIKPFYGTKLFTSTDILIILFSLFASVLFFLKILIEKYQKIKKELNTEKTAKKIIEDILEFLPDPTFVINKDKKVIAWNKAMEEMTDIPKSKILECKDCIYAIPFWDKIKPILIDLIIDKKQGIEEKYDNLEKTKNNSFITEIFLPEFKGGRFLWLKASPLLNQNGNLIGAIETIHDITKKKEEEKLLHQSQKMEFIRILTSGVAHDFNNILTVILSYIELAKMDINNPQKAEKELNQAIKSIQRATKLTKQILLIGRQVNCEKKPLELHLIIEEVLELLKSFSLPNIEIRKNITGKGYVLADSIQMYQVIMNLCTNASQAMENTGGILTIKLQNINIKEDDQLLNNFYSPGKYIKLTIEDTGPGIDNKTLKKIFDPYFTTKKIGKGTGLGLSIVNSIIKDNNGFINVRSVVGKGSTFEVFLPEVEKNNYSKKPNQIHNNN